MRTSASVFSEDKQNKHVAHVALQSGGKYIAADRHAIAKVAIVTEDTAQVHSDAESV